MSCVPHQPAPTPTHVNRVGCVCMSWGCLVCSLVQLTGQPHTPLRKTSQQCCCTDGTMGGGLSTAAHGTQAHNRHVRQVAYTMQGWELQTAPNCSCLIIAAAAPGRPRVTAVQQSSRPDRLSQPVRRACGWCRHAPQCSDTAHQADSRGPCRVTRGADTLAHAAADR